MSIARSTLVLLVCLPLVAQDLQAESRPADKNGGWKVEKIRSGFNGDLFRLRRQAGKAVWAVGDGGTMLTSSDGGAHWKRRPPTAHGRCRLLDVLFLDADHGVAVGFHDFAKTEQERGNQISFMRRYAGHYYMTGTRFLFPLSMIFLTDDGGKTWQPRTMPTNFFCQRLARVDERRIWLVSGGIPQHPDGDLWLSEDMGRTWKIMFNDKRRACRMLQDIVFVGRQGWAVGSERLIGIRISPRKGVKPRTGMPDINKIYPLYKTKGHLLYTSDGGDSWRARSVGLGRDHIVDALTFSDQRTGWLAAHQFSLDRKRGYMDLKNGKVLKTEDGGKTWKRVYSDRALSPNAIAHFRASGLAVCGSGGFLAVSDDGGATWRKVDIATSESVNSLLFLDRDHMVLAGSKGLIVRLSR